MQQSTGRSTARTSKSRGSAAPSKADMEAMREDLQELFLLHLKDIYYAEKQILKTLPKMAKAATNDELRQAFETHREQTTGQIERLEQVFRIVGERVKGETCEAIEGIIEEGKELMEEFKGKEALNVGLVGAAKAVEHYEMARYETLLTLAKHLGLSEAETLLQQNLTEEEEADKLLDQCGESMMAAG